MLHTDCRRRVEELELHYQIADLLRAGAVPRWRRAMRLARHMLHNPRPGLLAINAAALLRLLRGQPWFLEDNRSGHSTD
jgi:hypothetical protein